MSNIEYVKFAVDRSNYFRVRNHDQFVKKMAQANIQWWVKETEEEALYAITGGPQNGGRFPWVIKEGNSELSPYDIRETVQDVLHPDDTAILVGVLMDGKDYLDGWASVITLKHIKNMSLSEWVSTTLDKLGRVATDFNY